VQNCWERHGEVGAYRLAGGGVATRATFEGGAGGRSLFLWPGGTEVVALDAPGLPGGLLCFLEHSGRCAGRAEACFSAHVQVMRCELHAHVPAAGTPPPSPPHAPRTQATLFLTRLPRQHINPLLPQTTPF
jgi:hypothetical protein